MFSQRNFEVVEKFSKFKHIFIFNFVNSLCAYMCLLLVNESAACTSEKFCDAFFMISCILCMVLNFFMKLRFAF